MRLQVLCLTTSGVGLALLLVPALCLAAPCTLYKPATIANAKANVERHKWAADILASWQRREEFALGKDREFFRQMIADLTPWSQYGQVCPACVGEGCSPGETGVLQWSVTDPETLTCKYCKHRYPDPDYPETGVLECPNMGQEFTYYRNEQQRAHPEEDPGKHAYRWAGRPVHVSFSGLLRERKLNWVMGQVPYLAKLYALTDDLRYAQRVAWILERLAEVFPRYLYHSYGGCFADMDPAEAASEMGRNPSAGKFAPGIICHPAAEMRDRNNDGFGDLDAGFWGAGRLSTGASEEGGVLLDFVVAYDLTRDAVLEDGTPVYPAAVRKHIEDNLLLAGCADMENYPAINNKCGPGRAVSGAVGILFSRPHGVRRALEGFEKLLEGSFHFDGFCRESPAYSNMHLVLMQDIPDLLAGYSDPPDYSPEAGGRLDNFDPFTHVPRYRLALESMVKMLTPDLKHPVIGDTTAGGGTGPHYVEILAANYGARYAGLLQALQGAPLEQAGSEYALWHRAPDLAAEARADIGLRSEHYPGWQVGVLRSAADETQTAFYFNGYRAWGHRHADTLGILYHYDGVELASDRGYIWDDPRNKWTASTLAHNIVTVDGVNQNAKDRRSMLELCACNEVVETVQASAAAYEQCSQYRRGCTLVRLPEGGNYVVDVFRVTGGQTHQYGFNCNGEFLGLGGGELSAVEGTISYLGNLRAVAGPPETWSAVWRYQGRKMRLDMTGPLSRLLVTDAPGWRSYRGDQLHAPPITQLLAERSDDEGLGSVYTAVMSPFTGDASPVLSVHRILPAGDDTAVAVVVSFAEHTDYIISALDDTPRQYGPVTLAGRFGFASLDREGRMIRACLLDGTELSCGGRSLRLPQSRIARKVLAVAGSTITLDEPLPEDLVAAGAYLLSGETGFEIQSAEGSSLTVRDYPFEGAEEVVLIGCATLEQRP